MKAQGKGEPHMHMEWGIEAHESRSRGRKRLGTRDPGYQSGKKTLIWQVREVKEFVFCLQSRHQGSY